MKRAQRIAMLIVSGEHPHGWDLGFHVLIPRKSEPLVSESKRITWSDFRLLAAAYLGQRPDKVIRERIATGIVKPEHARARFGLPPPPQRKKRKRKPMPKSKRKTKAIAKKRPRITTT